MATKRLSKHFTLAEFDCRDGTPVPDRLVHGYALWCEWIGEPLRAECGVVHILSGFRTRKHNSSVGGAVHSVHLGETVMRDVPPDRLIYAAAADVVCRHVSAMRVREVLYRIREENPHLAAKRRGGLGYYAKSGFNHCDTAAAREWRG